MFIEVRPKNIMANSGTQSKLFKFIQSRVEYVELNITMSRPEQDVENLKNELFQKTVEKIQMTSELHVETATAIGGLIHHSGFLSLEQKSGILNEIEKRLDWTEDTDSQESDNSSGTASSPDKPNAADNKLQEIFYIQNMMTEKMWALPANPDATFDQVTRETAIYCKTGGVNHPTEKSVASIITILAGWRQKVLHVPVDAMQRLCALRVFKSTLRSAPQTFDGPKKYPEKVEDLQSKHPAIYQIWFARELPVVSKLSLQEIRVSAALTPCRSTKQLVAEVAAPDNNRGWNRMPRSAFGNILHAAANNRMGRGATVFALEDQHRPLALMDAQPGYREEPRFVAPRVEPPRAEPPRAEPPEPPSTEPAASSQLSADEKLALLLDAAKKRDTSTAPPSTTEAPDLLATIHGPKPKATAKAKAGKGGKKKGATPTAKATAVVTKGKVKSKSYNNRLGLVLGCSKCRYIQNGCANCRNPNFKGKRGHK